MTTVVGVGVIQALLGGAKQEKAAGPNPDDLDGKADTCYLGVKDEGNDDGREEEDVVIPRHACTRECAQVHIIYRIYREVSNEISVGSDRAFHVGEIEPVVGIQNRGSKVEKKDRPTDTGFFFVPEESHDEKDEPEEAHHHRKRNYPGV